MSESARTSTASSIAAYGREYENTRRRSSVIAEPHQIASTSPAASAAANRSQRRNAHTSSTPSAVGDGAAAAGS